MITNRLDGAERQKVFDDLRHLLPPRHTGIGRDFYSLAGTVGSEAAFFIFRTHENLPLVGKLITTDALSRLAASCSGGKRSDVRTAEQRTENPRVSGFIRTLADFWQFGEKC